MLVFCRQQDTLLYKEENFHIFVGDGVKQSKKGHWMLGVKKLFQESENSAKLEYIHVKCYNKVATV